MKWRKAEHGEMKSKSKIRKCLPHPQARLTLIASDIDVDVFGEAFDQAIAFADQRNDLIARIWIGGLSGKTL